MLYNERTNECLGGMTYEMTSKQRAAITADILPVVENGISYLFVENVSEPVSYAWYDKNGILAGTTNKVKVIDNGMTLRLTSVSDGAIADFDTQSVILNVGNISIEKIQEGFSVDFGEPVPEETSIRISSINDMGNPKVYLLKKGEQKMDIYTNGLSASAKTCYNISIFQRNVCIESKNLK